MLFYVMSSKLITQTFITASRQDLTRLFTRLADCINSEFISDNDTIPIIVEINGDHKAGKTIPWDMIAQKLTKGHAVLDPEGIEHVIDDDGGSHRNYETWIGPHRDTKQDVHIFCANVNDINDNMKQLILGDREKQKKLGDIILLNNTAGSIGHGASMPDIFIEIHFNESASPDDWARCVSITAPEGSPLYEQPQMLKLLGFPTP